MIAVVMSIIALTFIAYLTWDTMTNIKAIYACDWALPEIKELARAFETMWWILTAFGIVVIAGILNPYNWIPFV